MEKNKIPNFKIMDEVNLLAFPELKMKIRRKIPDENKVVCWWIDKNLNIQEFTFNIQELEKSKNPVIPTSGFKR